MSALFPRSIRPEVPELMVEMEIQQSLLQMERNEALRTDRHFAKKHMLYLKEHPKVNPDHYLSNLRTMIKIRP